MNTKSILFIGVCFLLVSSTSFAQTVLYSTDFDGPERAIVPDGWTQVPGWLHEPASTDPDFDWKAVSMEKLASLDPNSGDQCRDTMGYFRRDPDGSGNPLAESEIGTLFALERPPLSGQIHWERMSGSRAPWKTPPYFTGGEQPDGTYPETARVLVADSDEYGGVNLNQCIDSPSINLQGSTWVRIFYDSFFYANQDQSVGNWYKLDDGPWQPLCMFDNYTHGNDQGYSGPYSFAVNTQGASTLQLRWWLTGDYSWYWAIDNIEITGYNSTPPGPAKPTLVAPSGNVNLANLTQMRSSAFSDSTGGTHVFSEWEVRMENETWGNLVRYSDNDGDFLIDYPALRTSIQPNEFAVNAVNPDDFRQVNDTNARSEDPPHEPILFGREQPGAQFKIDLLGDPTVFNLPEHLFRPGMTYFARVRHWNNEGLASPWSDEVAFTVNPVALEVILKENFDPATIDENGISDTDTFGRSGTQYGRLADEGWEVSWLDLELGILQLFGDDLTNFNDVETDGRGLNGHFFGGVLHAQDEFKGVVTTPQIDNSTGGALTLIVDSSWRTSASGRINVLIDDQPTELIAIGAPYIIAGESELDNGGGGVVGDQIIYCNSYVLRSEEAAGQSNVKFQFEIDDVTFWTIDNVAVMQGEPVDVANWSVY